MRFKVADVGHAHPLTRRVPSWATRGAERAISHLSRTAAYEYTLHMWLPTKCPVPSTVPLMPGPPLDSPWANLGLISSEKGSLPVWMPLAQRQKT